MADEIRLKFTGDSKGLKKVIKSAEKLINRLEKSTKNSTNRRKNKEKTANDFIRRVRKKTAASAIKTQIVVDRALISSEKRLLRKRKSAQDQANRQRVAATKRTASDERMVQIRETTRTLQQEKRLSRRRARNRLRQVKSRLRAEKRLEVSHARSMRRIRGGISRGVGMGGKIAGLSGLVGGIGLVFKIREILDFDVALAGVAGQADITKKKQLELRETLTNTAIDVGTQRDVILRAISRLVDKSGEFSVVEDNVENIGKAIRGTGVDATELGAIIGAIATNFKGQGKPIIDFLNILVAQGDRASVTLSDMASNGEELMGAFKRAGLSEMQDFIEFFALTQIAGGGGTSPEAATFMKNFVIQIRKRATDSKLGSISREVLGEGGKLVGVKEAVMMVLKESEGDLKKLSKMFPNIRAAVPLELMATEFRKTGLTKIFDELIKIGVEANNTKDGITAIERRWRRVAETPSQGFERMLASITKFSDIALLPSLNAISNSIEELVDNKDKMAELVKIFKDFGETLKLVSTAGSKVAGLVMPIIKKRNLKRENKERFENLETMQQRRQALKGRFWTMQPEKIMKQNLDRIYIDIKNEFKQDETGKVKQNTATVETQVNPDRG